MSQNVFKKLSEINIEPSPYLKTRVLAHLNEVNEQKKKLLFWKYLFSGAFVALFVLGIFTFRLYDQVTQDGVEKQAYVLQVNFNENDLHRVARAEVVLPKDIHFVSGSHSLPQKSMKLPIEVKAKGPGRLPFVVSSDTHGEKSILVRLLDEEDNLVREQKLKFRFTKNSDRIAL